VLLTSVVRFKATGNAPIMKQNFYKITASNQFRTVTAFLWVSVHGKLDGHNPLAGTDLSTCPFPEMPRVLLSATTNRLTSCAVVVRFKATGNAPIMKQNFYKITASNQSSRRRGTAANSQTAQSVAYERITRFPAQLFPQEGGDGPGQGVVSV
jgi:hypothetical protein